MRTFLLCLCAAISLAACERVVDLQIPNGPRRLVVEARLERALDFSAAAQVIKLSTTADYFSGEYPPAASGATVRVTDDLNRITTFAETGTPGLYQAPTSFAVGRTRKYT
ncbi:MAG: hypothetical protein ABI852_17780, partial [Gemmatimonadaceae bacterium]